jgi:glutaminase
MALFRTGEGGPTMDVDVGNVVQQAYTGALPEWSEVESLVEAAYRRCKADAEGVVADYIPVLAQANPDWFAVSVAEVDGHVHSAGDIGIEFSIQSISKAFVYALVCEAYGHQVVRDRIGVNNTGLPFNSVIAIELNDGHPMNPMVNAGAIATTALVPGDTADQRWDAIASGLSEFAGRPLQVDDTVYRSESDTNQRNRAIAQLLGSYGRIDADPLEVVDIYTRQCALLVTAADLAVMGATLADGGSTRSPAAGWSRQACAETRWRFWRPTAPTSGPGNGCSRSVCRASQGWPVDCSRLHPVRRASAPFRRRWTWPATACADSAPRHTCHGCWGSTSLPLRHTPWPRRRGITCD